LTAARHPGTLNPAAERVDELGAQM
jgi:hypothetical protein